MPIKNILTTPARWLSPARLDRLEQIAIVILWVLLARRVYAASNPLAPLTLVAETAVVIFVLLRRPTEAISLRPGDWLLAITATFAPLLIMPADTPPALHALIPLGVGLAVVGNVVQLAAKLFPASQFRHCPRRTGLYLGVWQYSWLRKIRLGSFVFVFDLWSLALGTLQCFSPRPAF